MSDESHLQRIDDEVQRIVKEHAAYQRDRVEATVRAKGVVDTGTFADSIASAAVNEGLQKARIELSFDRAGRFADMGAGNMYKLGVYMGREERTAHLKGRKGTPAYSKAAYGTLSTLMNLLANMYVPETLNLMKQPLQDERTG